MFTPERHQYILQRLAEHGRVSIAELARELDVSDDTVRRDLRVLEKLGGLQKTHGGAVCLDLPKTARRARNALLQPVKQALGRCAANYPAAGSVLFIDAGSTVLEVARQLPRHPYTVITHSLDVAACLSEREEIALHLAGGAWDGRQRLFNGTTAEAFVRRFCADWAILGACAVDTGVGVTASEASDAEIKRGMLAASRQALLVADHSKFARHEPHWVAQLSRFDAVITDRAPYDAGQDSHFVVPDLQE
ncbi:DeoR/GlpR family DNA-binding transcription regulator [Paludibacterium yongneupense]|uniref:DeoR/GlpR family DNA-binding transcription regulator n=1 Tax=Paludibacterium yongneupense TaxID=400061 RepID=UPI0004152765|nr:DeoR/GlpR family DNA-binding transcription regulator [Paludibacterium yongneupense]